MTFTASRRKVRAGGVSKGKLFAPASSFLALVRVWVAEREGVAVGEELICPKLEPVVVDRAITTHRYFAGVDEGG